MSTPQEESAEVLISWDSDWARSMAWIDLNASAEKQVEPIAIPKRESPQASPDCATLSRGTRLPCALTSTYDPSVPMAVMGVTHMGVGMVHLPVAVLMGVPEGAIGEESLQLLGRVIVLVMGIATALLST